jgi:hypothetical protein
MSLDGMVKEISIFVVLHTVLRNVLEVHRIKRDIRRLNEVSKRNVPLILFTAILLKSLILRTLWVVVGTKRFLREHRSVDR